MVVVVSFCQGKSKKSVAVDPLLNMAGNSDDFFFLQTRVFYSRLAAGQNDWPTLDKLDKTEKCIWNMTKTGTHWAVVKGERKTARYGPKSQSFTLLRSAYHEKAINTKDIFFTLFYWYHPIGQDHYTDRQPLFSTMNDTSCRPASMNGFLPKTQKRPYGWL